ncbi:hypothetical protein TSUD_144080 [Trifolium subterraneum]|uniref:Protein APEM9 n=1 Tax=Trifolium subterraneum TaxID=3900 RepID=A0A2Z6N4D1_TRISU|nr:hypothetical protein TSUD_144080 [Trifolium subterraneum]
MEIMKDSELPISIWKQIHLSESYLVCSMYEEAASLASTILNRLRYDQIPTTAATQQQDMLQSAAMVLLQSFNQLGRTPQLLDQLRLYFISPKAIPPQLLLTGACFQIAQGSTFGVPEFLEEFLSGWTLGDGKYHALIAEPNVERQTSFEKHFELLRRLHSMHSLRNAISSQAASLQSPINNNETYSLKEIHEHKESPEALKGKHANNKMYRSKDGVSKLFGRIETCSWCFRAINLKFANAKFVIPSGKIMIGCLILFVCYVFRRKQATLKRIVRRQVIATKRALVDLWQLAFSYQVNPLAAVQPLTAATRPGQ